MQRALPWSSSQRSSLPGTETVQLPLLTLPHSIATITAFVCSITSQWSKRAHS